MSVTMLQVVAGARPASQIARFATPEVSESLVRRRGSGARTRGAGLRPLRVRAVVLSEPRDGIVDASVVVDDGRRARALALRLTGLDGRWVVTDLQVG